jgi:alkanesulfonate monooxygenase SsuD/methylene tetrahydromethanopterin reductase-like flavin-dependent oxidoreductase (luciferase family)
VCHAEAAGYDAAYVDGDVSQIPRLGEADVLDGFAVTTALLAATNRIAITSIRLVHHWNAARLAQASASLERLFPGRTRLPGAAERISWLDETLTAVRQLWRGETVSSSGRFVTLAGAQVRPLPAPPPPIEVRARGPRLLRVVAAHAEAWNVSLPPVAGQLAPARRTLSEACHALGRKADAVALCCPVFARPGADPRDPTLLAAYRRSNPVRGDPGRRAGAGQPGRCAGRLPPPARCTARGPRPLAPYRRLHRLAL